MAKALRGVIDDGTREIPLYNTFGKLICTVHIRPADVSIIDRYNALMKGFDSVVAPLKKINIKNDGTATFDRDWEILKKVEADLMEKINALFDMDDAEKIFATRNPFSSVGGEFFCIRVLSALGQVITEAIEEEAALSKKRMSKHLKGLEVNENAGESSENT